jgi:hypothetical protein
MWARGSIVGERIGDLSLIELASGSLPYSRHPCKSFVKLRHGCPGHARESVQVNSSRMFHTQKYASRHRFLRSAEPDIHLLSQTPKSRHRRLSVCSLPVPKQFVESLGSLISFAQSATCRTWQSAHGSSCLFSGSLQAAALLRSSAGIKSLCCRSTASRYATIFRATASVARFPFPFCFSLS